MNKLTKVQIESLVRGFYLEVDGGYCVHCSGQAVEVLANTFIDQKEEILSTFEKYVEEN